MKVSESTSYLRHENTRPIRKRMFVHQSQATLDSGNIYTSSAYEKTKQQYNERMSRLRNSNVSNHINMSPKMRKKTSNARFYEDEYGQEFELQPRVRNEREHVYASYGISSKPRLDHQALLQKYGSREKLNIYKRQGARVKKKKYKHTEYQY